MLHEKTKGKYCQTQVYEEVYEEVYEGEPGTERKTVIATAKVA